MKEVRKILPLSLYDITGVENWLEAQANAGLFPLWVGAWATFTRTGVPGTRFRLEPCFGAEEPDAGRLEHCRSAGWEYAFNIGKVYFLFYTTDPAASELYTDLRSRGITFDVLDAQLKRQSRRGWLIFAVILAILAVFVAWFFRYSGSFDVQPGSLPRLPLLLVELFQPYMVLMTVFLVLLLCRNRKDIRALRATVRAFRDGVEPVSPGPGRGAAVKLALTCFVAALALVSDLARIDALNPFKNIPLEDFGSPYVDLQELESVPLHSWDEFFEDGSQSRHGSWADREFSLLAPVWYSVTYEAFSHVSGTPKGGGFYTSNNGGYLYTPYLDMTYFRLLIPAMARGVAEAQLNAYRLVNIRWSYEEVDYPGLDFVILAQAEDKIWQMAAVASGGSVAVFRYAGFEDLADHLAELSEIVQ